MGACETSKSIAPIYMCKVYITDIDGARWETRREDVIAFQAIW